MSVRFPMLLLVVCLLAPSAFAQSPEVKKFVNAAITLYENLEYEKALKQLQKARAKAAGPDDEMKIGLLEGIVLADLGKEERSLTAFKTAFGLDPDAKLPVEVSPKVSVIAEKARANVRKFLAPQLEREKEEKRVAEEKKRAEEAAAKAAEQKKREEEARANASPPPRVERPVVASGPSGARVGAWVSVGLGVASAGAATFFLVSAQAKYSALKAGTVPNVDALTTRDSGKTFATLGYVFTGVAVAGLAAAVTLFLVSGSPADRVTFLVAPSSSGATVGVQGVW